MRVSVRVTIIKYLSNKLAPCYLHLNLVIDDAVDDNNETNNFDEANQNLIYLRI